MGSIPGSGDNSGWPAHRSVAGFTHALQHNVQVVKFLFIDYEVIVVAGKAVKLMHQDDIELFRPGCGYHLLKIQMLVGTGTLASIHEFFHYLPAFALGMVAASLKLKLRDEFLNLEIFTTLEKARVLIEQW
jgi:hypothetical protein